MITKASYLLHTSGLGSQGIERFFVTAILPQQRHGEFANVGNKHKEFAIFELCQPGVHHNFLRNVQTRRIFWGWDHRESSASLLQPYHHNNVMVNLQMSGTSIRNLQFLSHAGREFTIIFCG